MILGLNFGDKVEKKVIIIECHWLGRLTRINYWRINLVSGDGLTAKASI